MPRMDMGFLMVGVCVYVYIYTHSLYVHIYCGNGSYDGSPIPPCDSARGLTKLALTSMRQVALWQFLFDGMAIRGVRWSTNRLSYLETRLLFAFSHNDCDMFPYQKNLKMEDVAVKDAS